MGGILIKPLMRKFLVFTILAEASYSILLVHVLLGYYRRGWRAKKKILRGLCELYLWRDLIIVL